MAVAVAATGSMACGYHELRLLLLHQRPQVLPPLRRLSLLPPASVVGSPPTIIIATITIVRTHPPSRSAPHRSVALSNRRRL
ncbi:hypothetical protein NL676_026297 [Syzygium grande]|nr:hypothetical protein NL676_026297 [Syzygium grande]